MMRHSLNKSHKSPSRIIRSKPKISDGVSWRWDGEANQIIILSKEGLALPLILNPTAALIFSLCNNNNTVEDIAKILCDRLGIDDFEMVLEDVKGQLDYFFNKEIVQV